MLLSDQFLATPVFALYDERLPVFGSDEIAPQISEYLCGAVILNTISTSFVLISNEAFEFPADFPTALLALSIAIQGELTSLSLSQLLVFCRSEPVSRGVRVTVIICSLPLGVRNSAHQFINAIDYILSQVGEKRLVVANTVPCYSVLPFSLAFFASKLLNPSVCFRCLSNSGLKYLSYAQVAQFVVLRDCVR